jgi:hypothetical protein
MYVRACLWKEREQLIATATSPVLTPLTGFVHKIDGIPHTSALLA